MMKFANFQAVQKTSICSVTAKSRHSLEEGGSRHF